MTKAENVSDGFYCNDKNDAWKISNISLAVWVLINERKHVLCDVIKHPNASANGMLIKL